MPGLFYQILSNISIKNVIFPQIKIFCYMFTFIFAVCQKQPNNCKLISIYGESAKATAQQDQKRRRGKFTKSYLGSFQTSVLELFNENSWRYSNRQCLQNILSQMLDRVLCTPPQPPFTCLKLTIETLEQGVKYVLVSLSLTLNIFRTLFQCFYF